MRSGRASIGSPQPWKKYELPNTVMIRGALSPAILATANSAPVMRPALAAVSTTLSVVLHLRTPNASDASRTELGTSFRASSVVLDTIGIMMRERARAPAIGEK